jgi:hypothetical protein
MLAKELVVSFKICSFSKLSSMITDQRQNFSSDKPPETSYVEEFRINNNTKIQLTMSVSRFLMIASFNSSA